MTALLAREAVAIHRAPPAAQVAAEQRQHVSVDNGRDSMVPVQSNKPLMQFILGTQSQNIKVCYQHPSIGRKQLVSQARLSVLHLNQEEQ